MNAENNNKERRHNPRRGRRDNDNREPRPEENAAPSPSPQLPAEPDDDAATAEEMEAFIRDRKEKRSAGHKSTHGSDANSEVPTDTEANENAMDPYLEPDPALPKVKYHEPLYLSRGCNRCPESYVPLDEVELRSCCKVGSYNWMKGIRQPLEKPFNCVEVRFKNNRKDFFRIPDGIDVSYGDVVAVEGVPGHDVGIVSLTGEACRIQMLKKRVNPESESIKKLFRRAKASDIERWSEAIKEEENTLKKTRQIAEDLGLVMKVNDVEYQGDHSKAIFYYTADDRVDFRSLIKVLADHFHVRIEMKQIGVRQEAGKVGGIGTCGRELCCSTWLTNFKSVTTSVAKTQQILPNPQKLAGQCGKLKCCLNFEYPVYADALKSFPPSNTPIRFKKGLALYKKTDVFRGIMWYAYEGQNDLYAIKADDVKKIIEMNREQQYPEQLEDFQVELMSTAALAQEVTTDEFEREIQLLTDDGGSSNDTAASKQNTANRQRQGDGRQRQGDGRQRQPRENHQPRENRQPRDDHQPRENSNAGNQHRNNRNNDRNNDKTNDKTNDNRRNKEPRAQRDRRDNRRRNIE